MTVTAFKQVADNAVATTTTNLSSTGVTSLALSTGFGALFPAPGNGFIVTLWDNTTYPNNPGADPNMEKVVCSARSGDTLTIGATAKTHLSTGTSVGLLDVAQNTTDLQTAVNTLEARQDQQFFNVKAYGAVGDNSTDDTTAIQSAINAAQTAGGGRVWFPKGTYKITAALKLYSGTTPTITAYSNIILEGVGASGTNGSIINQYTTGADIIQAINDTANGAQSRNITIKNLNLAFAGATLTNSGNGIYLKQQAANGPAFYHFYLQGVTVTNCQGTGKYGFNFESIIVSTVENCEAVTCANGFYLNGAAASQYSSVNTSITFLNCYANMAANGVIGYNIQDTTYCSFISCAADIGANSTGVAYQVGGSNCITFQACGTELDGTHTLSNGWKIGADAGAAGCSGIGLYDCYMFQSKSTIDVYVTAGSSGVHIVGFQDNSTKGTSTGLKIDSGSSVTEADCNWGTVATPLTNAGNLTILNDGVNGNITAGGNVSVGGSVKIPNYGTLQNAAGVNLASFGAAGTTPINYISFEAEATGLAPTVYVTGSDTNISLNLQGKGTGRVQFGGVTAPSISSTDTLTNKRVTKRVGTAAAPGATPSLNTDNYDRYRFTGLAAAITSMTTNLTGTPVEGDELWISFKDNGTARAITWGAKFVSSGVATLLATTVANKTHWVKLEWDNTAAVWVCMAVDATGY